MKSKYQHIKSYIGLSTSAIHCGEDWSIELDNARKLAYLEYDELIRLAEIGLTVDKATHWMEE